MHLATSSLVGLYLPLAGLVGVLIVAAGIVGSAFRVSRNTTTLQNYREAATSWEAKANAQESEIGDLKRTVRELQDRVAEKDLQVTSLQQQISGLRDLLTQRAPFEALEARINENHDLLKANTKTLDELLRRSDARQANGGRQ